MKTYLLRRWLGLLVPALAVGHAALAQSLTRLEYYFDTDPGYGQGQFVTFATAGPSQDVTYTASLAGLTPGFHTLYTRVLAQQAGRRVWSPPQVRPLYVGPVGVGVPNLTRLEYFFDTDPGYGQGRSVAFTTPGPSVDQSYVADLGGLTPGFHTLYTRVRTAVGSWSLQQVRPLYVGPVGSTLPTLTYAEYFVDTDPGYRQGTRISFATPAAGTDQAFTADLGAVPLGFHTLFVRVRNAAGAWSLTTVRPFVKEGGTSTAAPARLTRCEYYFDADPGYGLGTAVPLTPGTSSSPTFTADLSAVGNGFHTLYVRVRDASRAWSLVSVRPFFKQGSDPAGPRPALTRVRYQLFAESSATPLGPARVVELPAGTTGPDLDVSLSATLADAPVTGRYVLRVAALDAAGIPSVAYAHALDVTVPEPLPVQLVAFAATRRGPDVLADWTTASELNSAYFALEASPDPAAGFAEVGRVAAAGTSSTPRRYALAEAGVPTTGGVRYYRLRQADLDGSRHYSAVRAVALAGTPTDLTLLAAPNPFRTSELQVRIGSPQGGPATLQVLDLPGRQVLSRSLTLTPGDNQLSLPELAALPAGAYLLLLRQGPQARQFKLLKE